MDFDYGEEVLDHDEGEAEMASVFMFGFAQPESVFGQVSLARNRVSTPHGSLGNRTRVPSMAR